MLKLLSNPTVMLSLGVLVLLYLSSYLNLQNNLKEGWGTSPATMIQLASSSGYYPYWRYGFGYRYPYYRYRYPYNTYYPMGYYPLPYGQYKYGLY